MRRSGVIATAKGRTFGRNAEVNYGTGLRRAQASKAQPSPVKRQEST